ncbi:MAG TPA: sulfurtransferase-like selenium metabolism protein YedF [Clostridia bacterium]|nr:sulfurtransferase-like selenium metabolism protein YedF [Clostridia bacterium]
MAIKTVDGRGLACPKPVLETKKALENLTGETLITLVDNAIAVENVKKLLTKLSYSFEVTTKDDYFEIKILNTKGEIQSMETVEEKSLKDQSILFTSNKIGKGDDTLGQVLMKGYIYTLSEMTELPKYIMFVNSGVELTTKGSESIDDLKALEDRGVEILSCGTCLDYLSIDLSDLAVGSVTNMYTIVDNTTNVKNTLTIG